MKTIGFRDWIKKCVAGLKSDINSVVPRFMTEYILSDNSSLTVKEHDFLRICSGAVYAADLNTVGASIALQTCVSATCSKVVIKGVTFKCRGLPPQDEQDIWNDLSLYWDDHRHSGSWCQVTLYNVVTEEVSGSNNVGDCRVQSKKRGKSNDVPQSRPKKVWIKQRRVGSSLVHGQIDYCFRITLPDELVNGIAFGHITTRATSSKTDKSSRGHCRANVGYKTPPAPQSAFIPLNYVNSTSIALSGLDRDSLPLLRSDYMSSFTRAFTDQNKNIYAPIDSKLHFLYFIELHPERVSFEYDSIWYDNPDDLEHRKIDANGTKVFEKKIPKLTTTGQYKRVDKTGIPVDFVFA